MLRFRGGCSSEVQRFRGAAVQQRCRYGNALIRNTEVHMCRYGDEVQRCRYAGAELERCIGAEAQRCRSAGGIGAFVYEDMQMCGGVDMDEV